MGRMNKIIGRKKELLKLAIDSKPKPAQGTMLYITLCHCKSPSQYSYDPEFIKKIEELRPDWFISSTYLNRKRLLKLAKDGKSKPKSDSKLCRYLYSTKDKKFIKEIHKLRPDWFSRKSDQYKKQLLELAKNGKSRPHRKTVLGAFINNVSTPNSRTYDEEFTKKIKRLRPDWFISPTYISIKRKIEFLKITPGSDKPIGDSLRIYTNKNHGSYDPMFDAAIRKLHPGWFIKRSKEIKDELLELAKNSSPKPKPGTNLYNSLHRYTHPKSLQYDPVFADMIIKLCPDWSTKNTRYKDELLELAKNSSPKPKPGTNLYNALHRYTHPKSLQYDPVFADMIIKLCPDWSMRRYGK